MIDLNEIRRRIQFMRENKISDPFALSLEEMEWVCAQIQEHVASSHATLFQAETTEDAK